MSVTYAWSRKCKLTVDYTKVGESLTDFPVLVVWTGTQSTSNLPREMFDATSTSSAKSDGSDIRFTTDAIGLFELAFDVVYFSTNANPSIARAEIYVKLTSLTNTQNTDFYVWYHNPLASAYGVATTYGKNNTWSNNYQFMYHLQDLTDAKGALGNATNTGSTSTTDRFGASNAAYLFNGTSSFMTIPAFTYAGTSGTYSGWIYRNGANTGYSGIMFIRGTATGVNIYGDGTNLGYHWNDSAATYNFTSDLTLPDTTWAYFSLRVSATAGVLRVNGSEATNTVAHATATFTGLNMNFGQDPLGSRFMNGSLSDLRFTTLTRSAGWILTEYNAESYPQTFIQMGSPASAELNTIFYGLPF